MKAVILELEEYIVHIQGLSYKAQERKVFWPFLQKENTWKWFTWDPGREKTL